MQIRFILCIWALYQTITLTVSSEVNDESRTNEDNYALRLPLMSDKNPKTAISSEGGHESDDNSRSEENNFIVGVTSTQKSPKIKKEDKEYKAEQKQGDMADLFGTNQHHSYPEYYKDLGRRFVLQYPYKEISNINQDEEAEINLDNIAKDYVDQKQEENRLIPVKASPELVLAVAAKSALLEATNPHKSLEGMVIDKEILRSGNYWNDVWREDVDPNILRTQNDIVESVKVKVMPDSKLYKLVSELKKISPRLLYVINKE